MKHRALITGAAGFVGRYLRDHLSARGWDIVAVDNAPVEETLRCDITDAVLVEALIANAAPLTHVFHLAALTFVPDAQKNPARAMRVNIEGTVNVAEALRRQGLAFVQLLPVQPSGAEGAHLLLDRQM